MSKAYYWYSYSFAEFLNGRKLDIFKCISIHLAKFEVFCGNWYSRKKKESKEWISIQNTWPEFASVTEMFLQKSTSLWIHQKPSTIYQKLKRKQTYPFSLLYSPAGSQGDHNLFTRRSALHLSTAFWRTWRELHTCHCTPGSNPE